jgi:predicted ATP-grasp superfamily ATP-dependent carboligase
MISLESPDAVSARAPFTIVRVGDDESRAAAFARLAREADWSLVIAPEIGGQLVACCRAVLAAGGRLLGPSPAALAVVCDKHSTTEALRAADVPTTLGISLPPGELPPSDFPFPAVLKPCDGAGSQDVQFFPSRPSAADWPRRKTSQRLERFCPGLATSVALLVGPPHAAQQSTGGASGTRKVPLLGKPAVAPAPVFETAAVYPLAPCRQHLSDDGSFAYLGGSLPIEPAMAARATAFARRTVAAVPGLFGYVGVDLVLGADTGGRDDFVIEINPRLTTSYLGLRKLATANLAAALLDVAGGDEPKLSFATKLVRFNACGDILGVA